VRDRRVIEAYLGEDYAGVEAGLEA
jgi:hypothetical protein